MLYLLIHTLTVTDCDYVLEAQFLHALGRVVAGRLSVRAKAPGAAHCKAALRCPRAPPDLKTLMKAKRRNVRHQLRTIKIASQPFQIQGSLDEKQLVTLSPASSNSERITQEVDTTSAFDHILTVNSSTHQTANWLTSNRFEKYSQTFANFSGADMLRTTREDLIQICGHADGIRLHNCLHSKLVAPKLTIYVCKENCSVFNAIFLTSLHNQELMQQLSSLLNVQLEQIKDMYLQGPQTIHVQINSDLIKHIKDESMFKINVLNENGSLILLLKSINK